MSNFNRVIMIGNLTRDPDYKQLSSGAGVTRLSIASNRQYKNRQSGSVVQEVCFIDVDVFGPQADSCRQYLQKGRPVLVEGRLKFDSWQTSDGQSRSKHSIVADRIVFLQSGASADVDNASEVSLNVGDIGLAAKVETPRPARAKSVSVEQSINEEIPEFSYKDEQPFQDDLPF